MLTREKEDFKQHNLSMMIKTTKKQGWALEQLVQYFFLLILSIDPLKCDLKRYQPHKIQRPWPESWTVWSKTQRLLSEANNPKTPPHKSPLAREEKPKTFGY